MATVYYGAEGTFISPGTWRGPQFTAEWRLYFTDETRYPVVTKSLHQSMGSTTSWTIEVYDNHGQHYSHMVKQSVPGSGFGCTFTTSFVPPDRVFRCVADKAFDKPLAPKLIDLVKTNNVQTCINAVAAATVDVENMMTERDIYKAEVEALKAELAATKSELYAAKTEVVAAKATKTEKVANTTIMMASALAMGILGLVVKASHGENYSQTVMPPSWPQLPGVGDLD